ncbi:MAG: DUF397 domain-containing protein [Pseudonocardiaceae bacterium]
MTTPRIERTRLPAPEPHTFAWRSSSYSGTGADCIEVAPAPERVLVRDSKNPEGPTLTFPTAAWRTFLTTLTR